MARRSDQRERKPAVMAVSKARAAFSELVRDATRGRSTGITNRGELVAFLVPASVVEGRESRDFVKSLGAWRRRVQAEGLAEEFRRAAFTKREVRDARPGRRVDL